MTYRFATPMDLNQLMQMVNQAKAAFKAGNINQWQKGEPDEAGLMSSINQSLIHVLEEDGKAAAMITAVLGPEASYAAIDGAWLNQEPYYAFHRVCVEESMKGRGLAARLFSETERFVMEKGFHNIRIDTHPDNLSMQRALHKSGYVLCGSLILTEGSEVGDLRYGYHKVI